MVEKCIGCGLCCIPGKLIELAKQKDPNDPLVKLVLAFPYPYDKNGVCSMLKDKKCTIYEDRPLICNSEELRLALYKDQYTKEEWQDMNDRECNKLKIQNALL